MERRYLPNKRQSKPRAAVCSAAGLVDAEERLEDALAILLGYSRALILNSQEHVAVVVADGDVDSRARAAVTDGIFDQVKHQPIEESVASDYQSASTAIEGDVLMLGKRSEVGEDFFGQGAKLNIVLAGNAAELTHLKQHLGHSRHPLDFFL